MDTRIYVMTHKACTLPESSLYSPLHVGHAISEELGYPGDDTGNHISEKNKNYCELTGIYWVWKNVSCDIVGICHYRRYFVRDEEFLTREYIEETLKKYQVIVSHSGCTEYASVAEHYEKKHYWKDMQLCRECMEEKCPEYLKAFDLCMQSNLFTIGNMMIAAKSLFDEYCSWLFDLLFEVEKKIDFSGYDAFQARVMGYLSERLLRVWLLHHRYKVREEKVMMIDPADRDNAYKAIQLKRECVGLILKDLLSQYQVGNYVNLVDSPAFEHDFGGKIPVWVCWWQGEEEMPELVKMCVESIRKNLPAERCSLYLITMDNVGDYVTFPQWVMDKAANGQITLTGLSDILRMGLLYRYGGMWIDATYYAAKQIEEEIFDLDFYTQKFEKPLWKADVVQGRWAGNLMYGKAGNVLFQFVLNAFYLYWFMEEKQIDYFLIDYLIDAAYDKIEAVRREIEVCPCSQPKAMELQKLLNESYEEEKYQEIIEKTSLFKLSRRKAVSGETITGKKTFYGKILQDTINFR